MVNYSSNGGRLAFIPPHRCKRLILPYLLYSVKSFCLKKSGEIQIFSCLGGIFPLKRTVFDPFAPLGLFFAALAAFWCVFLPNGNLLSMFFVPVCLLALGALGLLLLRREGCDRETLTRLLLPLGLALFLRAVLLPHVTLDYENFLSRWVEHFRQNGGLSSLKDPIGNYNVPYLYLLALLSYLPMPDLYGIKLFSILFDVLLAWGGYRLAKGLTSPRSRAPAVCFSALLLLPTVVLNGACWGQCDSVWAAFCVHALACAVEDRPKASLALLALAFSFKLQAIFIIPLWCALWFSGRVRFRHFFVFPGVFALTMLPAVLAGKPISHILSIYVDQAGDSIGWQTLNYNSPSVFALLPHNMELPLWAPKAGIAAAFLFMAAVLALLFWRRKALSDTALLLAGAALSLGIPFFLPYMHERYFFLGGVLLAILACLRPVHTATAAAAELASLGGYHAYLLTRYALVTTLFGVTWVQLTEGTLMLAALAVTLYALWRELN